MMADDIADQPWDDEEDITSINDLLEISDLQTLFPNKIQRDIFARLINTMLAIL